MKKIFTLFYAIVFSLAFLPAYGAINITLVSITHVKCYGAYTGAIDINLTGGVAQYSYNWSSGQTTQDLTNISADTYSVTVTDANSQTATASFNVTQNPLPTFTFVRQNLICYGDSNGSIQTTITGAFAPYTLLWNDSSTQANRTNLRTGAYTLILTDSNNCEHTAYTAITQPNQINITGEIQSPTFDACNDGAITITTRFGVGPLSFLWSTGDTSKHLTATGIGTYSITVTDSTGCSNSKIFEIPSTATVLDIPNANIYIVIDSVYHNYDCNNDGLVGLGANPEPRWKIRVGATFNKMGHLMFNPGDNVSCGYLNVNYSYSPIDSVCSNSLKIVAQSWEDDACGNDTIYNNSGFTCFGNYDDIPALDTFVIAFGGDLPDTWVRRELTEANGYKIVLRTKWEHNYLYPLINGVADACEGDDVLLQASGLPDTSYHFIWSDCSTSEELTAIVTDNYRVAFTNGICVQRSTPFYINFHQPPVADAGADITICKDDTIALIGSHQSDELSQWNGTQQDTLLVSPDSTTNYILSVTSIYGCASFDEKTVSVLALPDSAYIYLNTGNSTFYCSDTTAFAYQWGYEVKATQTNYTASGTGYYFTPGSLDTANNLYWVNITNPNGCSRKIYFNGQTITAVYDLFENNRVVIYPNPAKENCIVQFDKPIEVITAINITDLSGRIVFNQPVNGRYNSTYYLDVSALAQGVYLLTGLNNSNILFRTRIEIVR